jgi:hypothetical protein
LLAFENIRPGSRLRGLDPKGLAEVVQVTQFGPDALNVVFRVDGRVDQRLFEISTQKGWSQEALVYNELAQEWAHLEDLAVDLAGPRSTEAARQRTFDFDGSA